MIQKINSHYAKVFTAPLGHYRYIINMGGRGAGRSKVAAQRATAKICAPEYYRAAIMRLVKEDIKNSIFTDVRDNMEELGIDQIINITENPLMFRYGKNSIRGLGFKKNGDQKSKLKSLANFNEVIIEEADEIGPEDFIMLDDSLRTLKSPVTVMMNLNPPDINHWIIKRWFNLVQAIDEDGNVVDGFYKPVLKSEFTEQVLFIDTNYLVNAKNIAASTKYNWEQYRTTNPDHYWSVIRGMVSAGAKGRIYKNWLPLSATEFDALPYPSYYAIDFGFTNDPTAIVEIKEHNNRVYVKELVYRTGLINRDPGGKLPNISDELARHDVPKGARIYADCAEPKSIAELQADGWNVHASTKGSDSIRVGVDLLLGKEVFYTENSSNVEREQQKYCWGLDKNKEPTNKPIDDFNHAMDAIRYGVYTHSLRSYVGF